MNFGIISTGSRGDVQPFVALALGLMRKGHDVTLVTSENFNHFVSGFGVRFLPITGDSETTINSPEALQLLEGGNVFKFIYHLIKIGERTAPQANRDILRACERFDGLIVSVLPLPIVYSIAEKYRKPCAVVFLSLPPIPTREFPYQALNVRIPSWLNKVSYRLIRLAYRMSSNQINDFRKEIGLAPANLLKTFERSNMLAILAESQELVKRPADWPPNAHVSGFFYLPPVVRAAAHSWDIEPEGLEQWLSAGETPVYIGFGSIPIPNPAQFYAVLQGVLARKRVVLGKGWSVLADLPAHPNLFAAKYFDHDKLLPRCSVAIVHGGIGTIGAVLKSGIPIIVVSILADQPINGKLIERRELGFHIPFKKLTAERLLHAIAAAQSPLILENCRDTAVRIRTEDGVGNAVGLIEEYFEGKHRPASA
ncbi:MAG TPA: glycosyltransferase [Puia sp.]|nr:glycosyltransferase [Puia sp.]